MQEETRISNGTSVEASRVVPDSGIPDFCELWLPDRAVPVRIEYSAISDLRASFSGSGEGWGLLVGSSSGRALLVQKCELFTLKTPSNAAAAQTAFSQFLQARLTDRLPGKVIVGFFRTQLGTQPGVQAAVKDTDRNLAKFFPADSESIFMLIETTRNFPWSASLFAVNGGRIPASRTAVPKFVFDEYLLRNGYLPDMEMEPAPAEPSSPEVPIWQRKNIQWIAAASLIVLLLLASLSYIRPHSAERAEPANVDTSALAGLGLKIDRSGSDFEVSWNRSSAAVRRALGGMLTIRDGGITKTLPLDVAKLREGRILYLPLFNDIDFRLEIATNDHRTAAESVQVLGWGGRSASDLTSTASLDRFPSIAPPLKRPTDIKPPLPLPITTPPKAPPNLNNRSQEPVNSAGRNAVRGSARDVQGGNAAVANRTATQAAPKQTTAPAPDTAKAIERPAGVPPSSTPQTARPAEVTPAPDPTVSPNPAPTSAATVASVAAPTAAPKPVPEPTRSESIPTPSAAKPVPNPAPSAVNITPAVTSPAAPIQQTVPKPSTPPTPIQKMNPSVSSEMRAVLTKGGPQSQAKVSVKVSIDAFGKVRDANVVAFSGQTEVNSFAFKSAALRAAREWKFQPGTLDGRNTVSDYVIDFQFK